MIIFNKTNQVQELRVYDFATKRYYSIYVGSNSKAEVHHSLSTPDIDRLVRAGVFQVIDDSLKVNSKDYIREEDITVEDLSNELTDSLEDISEDLSDFSDSSEDENPEEKTEEVTKFICKICGGEYASSRGLANHMNKAHKD